MAFVSSKSQTSDAVEDSHSATQAVITTNFTITTQFEERREQCLQDILCLGPVDQARASVVEGVLRCRHSSISGRSGGGGGLIGLRSIELSKKTRLNIRSCMSKIGSQQVRDSSNSTFHCKLIALQHHVDLPAITHERSTLEIRRALLVIAGLVAFTHGVENDSGASETNARFFAGISTCFSGLSDSNAHICLHGIRSTHTSEGRVTEHGDEWQLLVVEGLHSH
mmetsp:Transcript_92498/g.181233  ORF Transcript_92498/g.181233 Transcript_92498/m.181233 type:complete len:224 (-) Transcript_92498:439-1110(-)